MDDKLHWNEHNICLCFFWFLSWETSLSWDIWLVTGLSPYIMCVTTVWLLQYSEVDYYVAKTLSSVKFQLLWDHRVRLHQPQIQNLPQDPEWNCSVQSPTLCFCVSMTFICSEIHQSIYLVKYFCAHWTLTCLI